MEWEGAIEFVRDNAWLVAGVAIIANLSLLGIYVYLAMRVDCVSFCCGQVVWL